MNWAVIIPVAFVSLLVIFFLARQNRKDEKKFENQLKNDYRKSKNEEGDTEIDEKIK